MKKFIIYLFALLGFGARSVEPERQFPPVPKWQPDFSVAVEQVLERMVYYSNSEKDIVMFKNGTAVILPSEMNDDEAKEYALKVVSEIYNYHPDMKPLDMDDGNILVEYNKPAYNVVINDFANKHIETIKKEHLNGLATAEVLFTPQGNNVFNEFGMKALYGRTFMFMDAQKSEIVEIYRHESPNE